MQNFTQDDFQPRSSTILFIKQFARMYSYSSIPQSHGYHHIPLVAVC